VTAAAVDPGGAGFGRLVRAEWTKLRSLRSTWIVLVLVVGLMVAIGILGAAGSKREVAGNGGPPYQDTLYLVHQPLTGDGTLVARVGSQTDSEELARAGIMVKASTTGGAPYASIAVTPRHGVRWQTGFTADVPGSTGPAPRWLKLVRSGGTVTGYESADGQSWTQVGSATLTLPATVQVGLFVTSPPLEQITRHGHNLSGSITRTTGRASFDSVLLQPSTGAPAGRWAGSVISAGPTGPNDGPPVFAGSGSVEQAGGVFTVTGSGDIGPPREPPEGLGDDVIQNLLAGVQVALIAVIALGVLCMTAEYRTSLVRTTFTAAPRRGLVLAAKATALAAVTFPAGLVGGVAAYLVARPIQRHNGFGPPAYPDRSLVDGTLLRALTGTALLLVAVALLALAAGTLLRRTASAVILVIALVVVPEIVAPNLAFEAGQWVDRVTPAAGLAVQQTVRRWDSAIPPWGGFAVICGWVVAGLAVAGWQLRRRDA
jgi:hypothetical protein